MDWQEKFDKGLNQSIDVSKKLIDKARDKAKKLGDQSLLAFEIKELEKENNKLVKELGENVYTLFADGGRTSISTRTSEIKPLIKRLEEVRESLRQKRSLLDTE